MALSQLCFTGNQPNFVLFQIRQGFRARWNDLLFSVERESDEWSFQVQDSATGRSRYSGHRSSLKAAQAAAAEFAWFQGTFFAEGQNPEKLAQRLEWKGYW